MATRWGRRSTTTSKLKSPDSSLESSPTPSFCTASETAERDDDVVTTAKTSPTRLDDKLQVSDPDTPMKGHNDPDEEEEEDLGSDEVLLPYRPAKKLPREVREHSKIYLEEELYGAAIEMLGSLMSSGGHRPRSKQRPALVPPPNQIAFLASLAIHPLYTNRPTEMSHRTIGSQAMQYLRGLLGSAGPVHANFRTAFDFEPWRRHGRRGLSAGVEDEANEEDEAMGGRFAPSHIVFSKAESFWRLLGWAFNCSALHPERWRYWESWLGFMADVLDADYRERERLDASGGADGSDWRRGSLLLRYVRDLDRSAVKGMVRALFADGSAASLREFPELYDREAKARTGAGNKRKRTLSSDLDLANDNFGDYFDDDGLSSEGSAPESPTRQTAGSRQKRMEEAPPPSEELMASVSLRLRFFDMVGKAFDFLDNAECQTELFGVFSSNLRSLPVPLYELYVASHRTEMDSRSQISLLLDAVGTFRPTSAPKPIKVDKAAATGGFVNMLIMEKCYLPFAATSTAEGNAKFSLVLESLFRILWVNDQVSYSAELDEAVRTGVALRNDRSKPKKNARSKDGAEEAARKILAQSGSRLEYLMEIVAEEEQSDGDTDAE